MKKGTNTLLVVLMVIFSTFMVLYGSYKLIESMLSGDMTYELINSVESPDKTKTLYIYKSDGGATTDYAYHGIIFENKKFEEENKDVYFMTCDSNHGAVKVDLQIRWIDDSTVEIGYLKGTRFFKQSDTTQGITVKYIEID